MTPGADLLTDLNDAQRAGVLHDGGPLIVLAGPGTGKTRLITHRVAHLVLVRGVDPSTIVAVTFTNKAAAELRERLAQLVGPSVADSVQAHTFHGFGLRLLRRFPDLSGVGAVPEIIDSAQRRRLLRALVRQHRVYGPMLALGEGALLDEAAAHIAMCRNNGLTPGACLAFAAEWGGRLGRGLGSAGGPIDDLELAAQRAQRAMFEAHSRLYQLFEAGCRERGWLTIDELVTLPAALLGAHERVRAIVRHDHRHFVVDEFQDVNLAQIELIRQLAPPESSPDLVVVGDDDQAIYEFRGADDRAFARFNALWEDARTLPLTENYRSEPPILEVANAVIARATQRFAPDKRIERARALADLPLAGGSGATVVELAADDDAGDAVAALAGEEIAAHPDVPLSRIAVIARTHTELDRIAGALELEDIPYQRRIARGVAEDEGVKDLLAWMELLVDPAAVWAVRRVLYRPPIGAPPALLAEWEQRFAKSARVAALTPGEEGHATRPARYVDWLRVHGAEEAGVPRFLALYEEFRELGQHARASEVVWAIATRADLTHADLLGGRDRARRVANLVRVVRFVRAVQHRLEAPGDLAAFWSYYHDLDDKEQGFGEIGESLVEADEDAEGSTTNALQLLTAHGAKGLEFDTVLLPRVNPPHGFPKTAGGDDRLRPPEGLIDRLGDDRDVVQRARAEERRVFYVACTRQAPPGAADEAHQEPEQVGALCPGTHARGRAPGRHDRRRHRARRGPRRARPRGRARRRPGTPAPGGRDGAPGRPRRRRGGARCRRERPG
ncbi:MAG: ATP-dependent helicase [Phycisphaerales bacterium]|nr:ATP-dependent helicase [Phycisphaerales bacterium]